MYIQMSEQSPLLSQDLEPIESIEKKPSCFRSPVVKGVLGILAFLMAGALFIALTPSMARDELQPLIRVASMTEHDQLDRMHPHERLLLIGDVHGMYKELHQLLDKVSYKPNKDKIVFLGDMITKGPDSLKVLDFAIEHNAYCVRGNHEDEIFGIYADHYNLEEPKTFTPHASETTLIQGSTPTGGQAEATVGPYPVKETKKQDKKLVRKLKPRHMEYLESCPAILKLGKVSKRGIEAVAVHAGLLWSEHDLENQPVEDVIRVRSIVPPDYTTGSEDPDAGEPWFNRWNDEQVTRPKDERFEVFYGHDASKGLQLRRYSKGLDTKCQRGGKLSAYVVEVDNSDHYHETLVQIKC